MRGVPGFCAESIARTVYVGEGEVVMKESRSLPSSAADETRIAEAVRAACVSAAIAAWEDAGLQGLCEAGRWEVAVGALRSLDLTELLKELYIAGGDLD